MSGRIFYMINPPYTYLIGWTEHDKWYYGVRMVNICEPENDLWSSYFTSSKYVQEFRKEHGEPDIVQVRQKFENEKDAILYEHKVLRRLKVLKSDRWLNKSDNKLIYPWDDQEYRKKMVKRWENQEHRKKVSKKMSESAKKRWEDQEYRKKVSKKLSESAKKRCNDPEYRKKMSVMSKVKVACTVCGFESNRGNIAHWHNDNCKYKNQGTLENFMVDKPHKL